MSAQRKSWIIAIGYVFLIYLTLGMVRNPINFLRANGVLVLSLNILYGFTLLFLGWLLYRQKGLQIKRIAGLVVILGCYYFVSKQVSSPEELIHFLQYGLVGIFFLRALHFHIRHPLGCYGVALILATMAGWLDEGIQGMMSSRHYDIRDVVLNLISAFLGLCIYFIFPRAVPLKASKS